jgi:two-component system, cell cycle sensor histidine kinase and response regulator CckA
MNGRHESPVLVAEDDESSAELTRRSLQRARHRVRAVRSVGEALHLLGSERFGVAVLDYRLEDGTAWPILDAARRAVPPIPVIIVTAAGDESVAAEALHRGATEYVIKSGAFWERLPALVDRISRAAEAEERNAFLAAVVEASSDAIVGTSMNGAILSWNPAAEHMLGYRSEEVRGKVVRDLVPPEQQPEIDADFEALRAGRAVPHRERVLVTKQGGRVTVVKSISPIVTTTGQALGTAIVARDVSTQRALELQLRHAQKLEAVGRLAGGVAHDFNNLLAVISGYGELLLKRFDKDDARRRELGEMLRAGDRAAQLTRQLLAFSRKQRVTTVVLDLNVVVAEVESMLRRLIGAEVQLTLELAPVPLWVRADRGQLEQVLVNLTVNARDAMPGGGALRISTHAEAAGHAPPTAEAGAEPAIGPWARLNVTDTGTGMTEEVLSHLFEPFFTTKGPGEGTGLGLSTAHGIVTQAGGTIQVQSKPGAGSTFQVWLPRLPRPAPSVPVAPTTHVTRGTETVLVAEDDDAFRTLLCRVLEENGYRTLQARDGLEALALVEREGARVDLLLSDLAMPRLGGVDLLERLRDQRSKPKILCMSGQVDQHLQRLGSTIPYLEKPFSPTTLLLRVREVLDGPAGR